MNAFRRALLWLLPLLGAVAWSVTVAHADARIGVAAAIKNQVEGRGARPLSVGSEVFANERIRTGDASSAQLMFLDKTVMSIGPKAELLLDKFAYDPNRRTGQVVVNAVQGSFRFVTGAQNPTNYAIKTPVATLGIRGTIVDLQIQSGQTFVGLVEGATNIRLPDGRMLTLDRPGTGYVIYANGQVKGPVPYNGSEPNLIEVTIPDRTITDIDQLNAIGARNFTPPKPAPQETECIECEQRLRRR